MGSDVDDDDGVDVIPDPDDGIDVIPEESLSPFNESNLALEQPVAAGTPPHSSSSNSEHSTLFDRIGALSVNNRASEDPNIDANQTSSSTLIEKVSNDRIMPEIRHTIDSIHHTIDSIHHAIESSVLCQNGEKPRAPQNDSDTVLEKSQVKRTARKSCGYFNVQLGDGRIVPAEKLKCNVMLDDKKPKDNEIGEIDPILLQRIRVLYLGGDTVTEISNKCLVSKKRVLDAIAGMPDAFRKKSQSRLSDSDDDEIQAPKSRKRRITDSTPDAAAFNKKSTPGGSQLKLSSPTGKGGSNGKPSRNNYTNGYKLVMLKRFKASKMTPSEFSARHRIKGSTFGSWLQSKKYLEENKEASLAKPNTSPSNHRPSPTSSSSRTANKTPEPKSSSRDKAFPPPPPDRTPKKRSELKTSCTPTTPRSHNQRDKGPQASSSSAKTSENKNRCQYCKFAFPHNFNKTKKTVHYNKCKAFKEAKRKAIIKQKRETLFKKKILKFFEEIPRHHGMSQVKCNSCAMMFQCKLDVLAEHLKKCCDVDVQVKGDGKSQEKESNAKKHESTDASKSTRSSSDDNRAEDEPKGPLKGTDRDKIDHIKAQFQLLRDGSFKKQKCYACGSFYKNILATLHAHLQKCGKFEGEAGELPELIPDSFSFMTPLEDAVSESGSTSAPNTTGDVTQNTAPAPQNPPMQPISEGKASLKKAESPPRESPKSPDPETPSTSTQNAAESHGDTDVTDDTYSNEFKCIKNLQERELLVKERRCAGKCNKIMGLKSNNARGKGKDCWVWECDKCTTCVSVRKNSPASLTKMSLHHYSLLCELYTAEETGLNASKILGMDISEVNHVFKQLDNRQSSSSKPVVHAPQSKPRVPPVIAKRSPENEVSSTTSSTKAFEPGIINIKTEPVDENEVQFSKDPDGLLCQINTYDSKFGTCSEVALQDSNLCPKHDNKIKIRQAMNMLVSNKMKGSTRKNVLPNAPSGSSTASKAPAKAVPQKAAAVSTKKKETLSSDDDDLPSFAEITSSTAEEPASIETNQPTPNPAPLSPSKVSAPFRASALKRKHKVDKMHSGVSTMCPEADKSASPPGKKSKTVASTSEAADQLISSPQENNDSPAAPSATSTMPLPDKPAPSTSTDTKTSNTPAKPIPEKAVSPKPAPAGMVGSPTVTSVGESSASLEETTSFVNSPDHSRMHSSPSVANLTWSPLAPSPYFRNETFSTFSLKREARVKIETKLAERIKEYVDEMPLRMITEHLHRGSILHKFFRSEKEEFPQYITTVFTLVDIIESRLKCMSNVSKLKRSRDLSDVLCHLNIFILLILHHHCVQFSLTKYKASSRLCKVMTIVSSNNKTLSTSDHQKMLDLITETHRIFKTTELLRCRGISHGLKDITMILSVERILDERFSGMRIYEQVSLVVEYCSHIASLKDSAAWPDSVELSRQGLDSELRKVFDVVDAWLKVRPQGTSRRCVIEQHLKALNRGTSAKTTVLNQGKIGPKSASKTDSRTRTTQEHHTPEPSSSGSTFEHFRKDSSRDLQICLKCHTPVPNRVNHVIQHVLYTCPRASSASKDNIEVVSSEVSSSSQELRPQVETTTIQTQTLPEANREPEIDDSILRIDFGAIDLQDTTMIKMLTSLQSLENRNDVILRETSESLEEAMERMGRDTATKEEVVKRTVDIKQKRAELHREFDRQKRLRS